MSRPWHLLTGEFPPQAGGVSDYTGQLASALAAAGEQVHVWAPAAEGGAAESTGDGVAIHRIVDVFSERGLAELSRRLERTAGSRTMLVQYVPHAFGARGMNLRFCRWVQLRARTSDDVRVMFHEPYYPFSLHWRRNVLAIANRVMAVLLLSDTRTVYVSTTAWERRLRKWAPRATQFTWLPIPSTIPAAVDADAIRRWRERATRGDAAPVVGHFGTYGTLVTTLLAPTLRALLASRADVRVVLIGPGGEALAAALAGEHPTWGERVLAPGRLDHAQVAACVRACDVMLQPYADGISGRRTTAMAALANGAAVVTNRGPATEPAWVQSAGVAFSRSASSGDLAAAVNALLDDGPRRVELAAAGATLYDRRFSMADTVRTLRAGNGGDA